MSHFGIDTPFGERLANSSCKTRKLDPDVLDILNCGQSGTLTKALISSLSICTKASSVKGYQ